ncbi:hypothetical protein [Mangrovimonas spongiae]|uniref:Uncharacterized protein n=1 Tax=Mangrovimonas spongiae TaxID=2494697 RepID=A0A428K0V0_9FLAO|nr:hypothetical protein [Mangrovimonas spongiae]RSK39966.1 hypothetical protein EJA19_08780 [Mangrovimonas spongiae]
MQANDSLEDIIKGAFINMTKAFIFYVPERLITLLKLTDNEEVQKMINKVYVIDSEGYFVDPNEKATMISMQKRTILNEAIFNLYALKDKYTKEQFDYIVEKYSDQVDAFLFLTEWMNTHVAQEVENLTKDQQSAFEWQYQTHQKHKDEFAAKFQVQTALAKHLDVTSEKTKAVIKNFKSLVPNLNQPKTPQTTVPKPQTASSTTPPPKQGNKRIEKKQRLEQLKATTKDTAENFLLETVFNLKIAKKC